jgi:esterase/lipase superfamily enzyme
MEREYRRWFSPSLGRNMELLVFGHRGTPVIAFPTSCGRFFDFEDGGMIASIGDRIERGELHLFCVDSVDSESWYNRSISPQQRIARQILYERYLMEEVVPFVRGANSTATELTAVGCSFGGYHAANLALRFPEIFTAIVVLGAEFDPSSFLDGYLDDECYLRLPFYCLGGACVPEFLERWRRSRYSIAVGECDSCRGSCERMAEAMRERGIAVRFDVWGEGAGHDWVWWRRMLPVYL